MGSHGCGVAGLVVGAVLGCASAPVSITGGPTPARRPSEPEIADLGQADRAFAAALYGRLRGAEGNIFFSPASIRMALAMVWAGARGETAAEMASVLGLGGDPATVHATFATMLADWNERTRERSAGMFAAAWEKARAESQRELLQVVNRVWAQEGQAFRPEYIEELRRSYGAPLETVDFEGDPEGSRRSINHWIDDRTQHRIPELVPPGTLPAALRVLVTNAVHFKADWASQFLPWNTQDAPFWTSATTSVPVPLMFQLGDYRWAETPDAQILELPYASGHTAMVVVLPHSRDGLAGVEAHLAEGGTVDGWLAALRPERVEVHLPRCKTESRAPLREALSAMGLRAVFEPTKADLSGISGTRDLFLYEAIHAAFLKVDEEGTEASAATAANEPACAPPDEPQPPKQFRADHPFLFFIRDLKYGCILFIGRIADPRD